MTADDRLAHRLDAMREAFDGTFARPERHEATAANTRVLVVRVGAVRYAIPLSDCAALLHAPPIRPLPTAVAAFRGVAMADGALVAVYDLAALLRVPPGGPGRWLLVTAGRDHVALLIEALAGHGRTAAPVDAAIRDNPIVNVDGTDCRLLQMPRLLDELRLRVGGDVPKRSDAG